jgi:hypothetical protein
MMTAFLFKAGGSPTANGIAVNRAASCLLLNGIAGGNGFLQLVDRNDMRLLRPMALF